MYPQNQTKSHMYIFFPNFLFQPPKLPLPIIELTLKRYLNAVETFTPPDQFSATSKLVQAQYLYWDSKLLAPLLIQFIGRLGRATCPGPARKNLNTGGPPLTQKSLTRFPLPRFLAYVCVSGGFSH